MKLGLVVDVLNEAGGMQLSQTNFQEIHDVTVGWIDDQGGYQEVSKCYFMPTITEQFYIGEVVQISQVGTHFQIDKYPLNDTLTYQDMIDLKARQIALGHNNTLAMKHLSAMQRLSYQTRVELLNDSLENRPKAGKTR